MSILKIKNKDGSWTEVYSLQGPQGEPGPQGIQGEKGDAGQPISGTLTQDGEDAVSSKGIYEYLNKTYVPKTANIGNAFTAPVYTSGSSATGFNVRRSGTTATLSPLRESGYITNKDGSTKLVNRITDKTGSKLIDGSAILFDETGLFYSVVTDSSGNVTGDATKANAQRILTEKNWGIIKDEIIAAVKESLEDGDEVSY